MVSGPSTNAHLPELPQQPAGVPWPQEKWATAEPILQDPQAWRKHLRQAFELRNDGDRLEGQTYALLVVQGGRLVHEQYDHGASDLYLQYSWSMAKSVVHALIGFLVADGRLDIDEPAPVPEWQAKGDPRGRITLHDLLRMRDGLNFAEDYVDGARSDVSPMLFGQGRHDTAAFTASKPLAHEPGSHFNYSSGTTNIICRILADTIGGGPTGMLHFMEERLFGPLGMRSPTPKFDTAGTFIGSSFLHATPQDFAKFGLFYLRGGQWQDKRLLPAQWVDYARTESYRDPEQAYGAHWWLHPQQHGWFYASGYDGQRILLVPEKDVIVVRCGRTNADHAAPIWRNVRRLVDALA